jgi:hypothetical protein
MAAQILNNLITKCVGLLIYVPVTKYYYCEAKMGWTCNTHGENEYYIVHWDLSNSSETNGSDRIGDTGRGGSVALECIIKVFVGRECVDCMQLAQDKAHGRVFVNTVMNTGVKLMYETSGPAERMSSQAGICFL